MSSICICTMKFASACTLNKVGASIYDPLLEMCEAAGDRPVLLPSPIL